MVSSTVTTYYHMWLHACQVATIKILIDSARKPTYPVINSLMDRGAMPRKKSMHLTDAELRLMEVIWERQTATVADVVQAVSKEVPLAYSSVLTTMRILEQKGYIRHKKDGRAFIYKAIVARGKARDTAIVHLLRRFLEGSPELLMLNLVEKKKISAEQLKRLQK